MPLAFTREDFLVYLDKHKVYLADYYTEKTSQPMMEICIHCIITPTIMELYYFVT